MMMMVETIDDFQYNRPILREKTKQSMCVQKKTKYRVIKAFHLWANTYIGKLLISVIEKEEFIMIIT